MNHSTKETGFALLITLIVVGVVLSVGLTILDLSVKQVRLSSNAKESEVAFHAANAGMECARYWRRVEADTMEIGGNITPTCFGVGTFSDTVTDFTGSNVTGTGEAFLYSYSFTWGTGSDRCTQIDTLVASSSISGAGMTVNNIDTTIIQGYPDGSNLTCDPGSLCTVISVRGYNKPCTAGSFGYGTVQREVLLQF